VLFWERKPVPITERKRQDKIEGQIAQKILHGELKKGEEVEIKI